MVNPENHETNTGSNPEQHDADAWPEAASTPDPGASVDSQQQVGHDSWGTWGDRVPPTSPGSSGWDNPDDTVVLPRLFDDDGERLFDDDGEPRTSHRRRTPHQGPQKLVPLTREEQTAWQESNRGRSVEPEGLSVLGLRRWRKNKKKEEEKAYVPKRPNPLYEAPAAPERTSPGDIEAIETPEDTLWRNAVYYTLTRGNKSVKPAALTEYLTKRTPGRITGDEIIPSDEQVSALIARMRQDGILGDFNPYEGFAVVGKLEESSEVLLTVALRMAKSQENMAKAGQEPKNIDDVATSKSLGIPIPQLRPILCKLRDNGLFGSDSAIDTQRAPQDAGTQRVVPESTVGMSLADRLDAARRQQQLTTAPTRREGAAGIWYAPIAELPERLARVIDMYYTPYEHAVPERRTGEEYDLTDIQDLDEQITALIAAEKTARSNGGTRIIPLEEIRKLSAEIQEAAYRAYLRKGASDAQVGRLRSTHAMYAEQKRRQSQPPRR